MPVSRKAYRRQTEYKKTFSWRETVMLYWSLVFLIVALVAGFFGFVGVAGTAYGIAKILFFIFLVLFIVSLLAGGLRRPLP
jgi:uncharacterized membrane protein YtjA (UPF0391 family)